MSLRSTYRSQTGLLFGRMVLHLGHTQVVDKQPRRAPKIATRVWRVSPPVGWIGRWSTKSLVPKILHIDFGLESRACATRRHGSWHCGTIPRRASSLYVPRPSRCSKLVCSHELIVLFFSFVPPLHPPGGPEDAMTPTSTMQIAVVITGNLMPWCVQSLAELLGFGSSAGKLPLPSPWLRVEPRDKTLIATTTCMRSIKTGEP